MIKYDVGYSKKEIKEIEVISETACFVTIKGVRTDYKVKKESQIFDTFDEAKNYIVDYHKLKVSQAISNLQFCKSILEKVNDISKP